MTVTIQKKDPLAGVPNKAQIIDKIDRLKDADLSYTEFTETAGWLRGARTVLKSNPKLQKAAEYVQSVLRKVRHADDTDLGE